MGDGGNAAGDRARGGKEGGNEAGGGAEGGVEHEGASLPIDAGIVARQPRKTQHQREVGEVDELKGNVLRVGAMNADAGGVEVSDGGGRAAVNEFHRDGMGVGGALQHVGGQNRGIQKGAGGARVDERQHGDGKVARDKKVNCKGEVARGREGEGSGEGKYAAQPGPYWLGREFFEGSGAGRAAGGVAKDWV